MENDIEEEYTSEEIEITESIEAKIEENKLPPPPTVADFESDDYYSSEEEAEKPVIETAPFYTQTKEENAVFQTYEKTKPIQSDSSPIPPNLLPLIFHSSDSLTYRALAGNIVTGLSPSAQMSLVNDLKKYMEMAVDHNYITEAIYVQTIIDKVKEDKSSTRNNVEKEISQIDQKIKETKMEIDERTSFWNTQEEALNKELEISLGDLEAVRNQAISDLDEEWQSPKKKQLYSKPSPALLNLRHVAKKMIKAKQFDEVTQIGKMITEKEQEEILEATERMNIDYRAADQRIHDKFDAEKVVIIQTHESKLNNLQRSKEKTLRPILQRLENLNKSKNLATASQKKIVKETSKNTARQTMQITKQSPPLPSIFGTPKLSLPSITPLKRDNPSRSTTGSPSITRPKARH